MVKETSAPAALSPIIKMVNKTSAPAVRSPIIMETLLETAEAAF